MTMTRLDEAVWGVDRADWARVQATHMAAQATVTRVLDLEVPGQVWVGPEDSRGGGAIGQAPVGGGDAQLMAIALASAAIASVVRLAEMGYDTITQAGAEAVTSLLAAQQVSEWLHRGLVVWPRRAERDAEALLQEPAVWAAVDRLTGALQRRAIDEADLDAVIAPDGDPTTLSTHPVWTPDER